MSDALAGTAYMSLDGQRVQLAGEYTWKPSTDTREPLLGMDGYHGHKTKPTQGEIHGKVRDSKRVSVKQLGDATDITITVELVNGKVIIGRNMACMEPPEVDAEEGTIDMKWFGPQVGEG